MKTFFCLVILFSALVFLPNLTSAAQDSGIYTYLFRLYYDNGQLFADRDFEFKYDLIAEPFVQPALDTSTPYRGEVVNLLGKVVGTFQFDPTVTKGKISVKGPYFSDAEKVNFYNSRGEPLLTLSVSESSVCDDDSTCDSNVGENYTNCPNDCPKPTVSPSPTVTPSGFFGLGLSKLVLIFAGAVLAAVVIWIIWAIIKRKRASADQNQNLPPAQTSL